MTTAIRPQHPQISQTSKSCCSNSACVQTITVLVSAILIGAAAAGMTYYFTQHIVFTAIAGGGGYLLTSLVFVVAIRCLCPAAPLVPSESPIQREDFSDILLSTDDGDNFYRMIAHHLSSNLRTVSIKALREIVAEKIRETAYQQALGAAHAIHCNNIQFTAKELSQYSIKPPKGCPEIEGKILAEHFDFQLRFNGQTLVEEGSFAIEL